MPISPAQAPVVLAGVIMPRSYSVRAARICGWNSSGLRQSWPSVTSAFTVLKSPCTCPKSVSKAQKARRMPRGTPKSCSAASKTASNSLPLARPVCRRLLLISACEKSRKGFWNTDCDRSAFSTLGSCRTLAKKASIRSCGCPCSAASAFIASTKAPKSPPQGAERAGLARVQSSRVAARRTGISFAAKTSDKRNQTGNPQQTRPGPPQRGTGGIDLIRAGVGAAFGPDPGKRGHHPVVAARSR